MPSFTLPRARLLTKPWQYRRVYAQGRRWRGGHFSLICLANAEGRNRLGISVHGVKSAVRRNRLKRIIREFYRHHPSFIAWGRAATITPGTGVDVIFTVRSGFTADSPQAIEQAVRGLLERRRPGKSADARNNNAERKTS